MVVTLFKMDDLGVTPLFLETSKLIFKGKLFGFRGRYWNPFDDTGFDWSFCIILEPHL